MEGCLKRRPLRLDLGPSKLILAVRDESKGETALGNIFTGRGLEPEQA